ncbi:MBOAT family O-acyltransferase [Methylomonas sp. MED-D]|uniref:MBOAT family O-acyltransferase n=1 Tax=unclassified Methylomonas TaxID=2608980 RepID=UPI0028A34C83|nr:MBOAT family O-acyltransferase [Methylomonas sp. MV1]MDT4328976.1 MBOAT family O-acyltransferase [Methylomonas sp. MV1]
MLFSSPIFLCYFLPIVVLLYFILPCKKWVLLLASLIFYAWGEPVIVGVLFFVILFNYCFGCLIGGKRFPRSQYTLLLIGVVVNLAVLVVFKYLGFFVEALNQFANLSIPVPEITLPLGVSFFTFQAISYLVDIQRGEVVFERNLLNLAVFKAFFPQLISGPIVRFGEMSTDLHSHKVLLVDFSLGVERFVIGLSKKLLIADTLSVPVDRIFNTPATDLSSPIAWLGLLCFAFQIYFDFSGYTDMAIGLGRMFGFHFPENFNYPYAARSVQEFWRRWHMTLSRWFRDYLYIPLGGNRHGPARTYFNLWTVFCATGLWHGASWNFLLWGIWHGGFLVLERSFLEKPLASLPSPFRHAYTFTAVILGWVWFRAETVVSAVYYFSALFSWRTDYLERDLTIMFNPFIWVMLLIAIIFSFSKIRLFSLFLGSELISGNSFQVFCRNISLAVLTLACVGTIAARTLQSFIYFRF